jgi:hypothetical protein
VGDRSTWPFRDARRLPSPRWCPYRGLNVHRESVGVLSIVQGPFSVAPVPNPKRYDSQLLHRCTRLGAPPLTTRTPQRTRPRRDEFGSTSTRNPSHSTRGGWVVQVLSADLRERCRMRDQAEALSHFQVTLEPTPSPPHEFTVVAFGPGLGP